LRWSTTAIVVVVVEVVVEVVTLVLVVLGTVYVGAGSGTQLQVVGSQKKPGIVVLQLKSAHSWPPCP
jgi:hypothetical protein